MSRLSRNRLRGEGWPQKNDRRRWSPAAVGVCSCAGLRACLSRGSSIERGSTWNASGQGPVPSNWRSAAQPLRTLIVRHWITSCSGKARPSRRGVYVPPPGSFPEDRRPRLIARLVGKLVRHRRSSLDLPFRRVFPCGSRLDRANTHVSTIYTAIRNKWFALVHAQPTNWLRQIQTGLRNQPEPKLWLVLVKGPLGGLIIEVLLKLAHLV